MIVVQTKISASTLRKLDALAKADGKSRAGYLRHLIIHHIKAVTEQDAEDLAIVKARLAKIDSGETIPLSLEEAFRRRRRARGVRRASPGQRRP